MFLTMSLNWPLFFSVFSLIFIAELPDKTAFATLLMATRSRPLPLFIGVALAFLIQTIVAACFGSLLAMAPEKWVHVGAGILFLGFAAYSWRDASAKDDQESAAGGGAGMAFWPTVWKSFLVIFIAEWGDITQIATASLIAKYRDSRVTVFVAAVSALWAVTLVAILLGNRAKNYINSRLLKRVCAVLFLIIGVYFVAMPLLK